MKLIDLVNEQAIFIGGTFSSPLEVINHLTDKLCSLGKINNKELFTQAVLHREQEGPTALGEGLAVPHGKSDAVSEPCFAIAITKEPIQWPGIDEDEEVQIIVLLGIPLEHQGDTHIILLSELTGLLIDDEFRAALLEANTVEDIINQLRLATA